jgi:hypothetical protein
MSIKTTVGQVSMEGGGLLDQPSGILVDELVSGSAKAKRQGNLYVLAEISGPAHGRDAMTKRLVQTVHQTYFAWHGSVTAGLQQAVRQANEVLFDENRNSLPGERWTAGISCVVLRETDLFVGQAGPAAVILISGRKASRFPELSPWLDDVSLEDMDAVPLGVRRDLNVGLYHAPVSEGDRTLILDSDLMRRLSPETWPGIMASEAVDEMLENLVAAGEGSDLSAIVVNLGDGGPVESTFQPATPTVAPEADTKTSQPVGEVVAAAFGRLGLDKRFKSLWQAVLVALGGLWAALMTLGRRLVPGQVSTTQATTSKRTATRKRQPVSSKPKKGSKSATAGSGSRQKVLLAVAVAIPLIVAVVVAYVVLQRGQSQKAEIEGLMESAASSWRQAGESADTATSRAHLAAALGAVDSVLEVEPERADALDLRGKILTRQDEVNGVRRVNWMAPLKRYPASSDLSRVVVEGQSIFVMDKNAGKVYHHKLDEFQQALDPATSDTLLVSKGQQVDRVLVSDLVDMVWMPVGPGRQKAKLVILESGGGLLEYDPATDQLVGSIVAGSSNWSFPELIGSYYGRLYVLDTTANKIWRYDPTPDGYSSSPQDWLQTQVDLIDVVDMAIGDSIYLLSADGAVRKLSAGEQDTFELTGWDVPPGRSEAFFTRPPEHTQSVYFADQENSRIARSSKEGAFQRQFRLADSQVGASGDPLAGVTSLFVDEIGGHAFFVSGQHLYIIVLPE